MQDLAMLRASVKRQKIPIAFIKIELGDRYEDLAVYNPDLILTDSIARSQLMTLFEKKILAVIRAGLADGRQDKQSTG